MFNLKDIFSKEKDKALNAIKHIITNPKLQQAAKDINKYGGRFITDQLDAAKDLLSFNPIQTGKDIYDSFTGKKDDETIAKEQNAQQQLQEQKDEANNRKLIDQEQRQNAISSRSNRFINSGGNENV